MNEIRRQGSAAAVRDAAPCAISVVVPVYKEASNIGPFLERIRPVLARIGTCEILFCLDPSPDDTEAVIRRAVEDFPEVALLTFSRRFGQPAATMAGILNCRGAYCAVIDVDLQDPPELIEEMYRRALGGFEVVYARRRSREGETLVKKVVSEIGYKVINLIANVEIPRNTGDFRVMSRRVIEELRYLPEGHGFLRGLVALVGFRQTYVEYDRSARHSGAGHYNPLLGSLKIGFNGVIGFSSHPLSMLLLSGTVIAALSFVLAVAMVLVKLLGIRDYPLGVPTLTVLVLFMGGVQLIAVGVLGEYVGRIYNEVRRRPMYVVDDAVNVELRDPRGPGTGAAG
jgi:glycosyltransferase involved in cell wall biosynthesis